MTLPQLKELQAVSGASETPEAGRLTAQELSKISCKAPVSGFGKRVVPMEPCDHERRGADMPEIVALSFFSGAMGLDIGMRNGGIRAILACESDRRCRMTIQKNDPNIALIGDIRRYDTDSVLQFAGIPRNRKVDVMFGGPPCQSFSTVGARRAFEDERGSALLRYIELAARIRPTYFVLENVRGLLSASRSGSGGGALMTVLEFLRDAGYAVSFELYNAANFGAPQIRERLILIGKLGKDKVPYLSPTHSENGEYGLPKWRTLRDALEGLATEESRHIDFPERRLKFFRMLREGQYWRDLPPEAREKAMGESLKLSGGKTGFYRRLRYDRPSPTLVTNPTMPATDLCHPTEDRPLSVEEYRCIQEFPPEWVICGSIREQYRQIGNAVPIRLGEAVAKTITADMRGVRLPQYPGFRFSRYRRTNDETWRTDAE